MTKAEVVDRVVLGLSQFPRSAGRVSGERDRDKHERAEPLLPRVDRLIPLQEPEDGEEGVDALLGHGQLRIAGELAELAVKSLVGPVDKQVGRSEMRRVTARLQRRVPLSPLPLADRWGCCCNITFRQRSFLFDRPVGWSKQLRECGPLARLFLFRSSVRWGGGREARRLPLGLLSRFREKLLDLVLLPAVRRGDEIASPGETHRIRSGLRLGG